jgi:hypothetical protein
MFYWEITYMYIYTFGGFSIFRIDGSLKKIQRTHILARLEILYRMVHKTSKKDFAVTSQVRKAHVIR